MRRLTTRFVMSIGCVFIWAGAAGAQGRGGSDWTTAGNDAQRSSWLRSDPKISSDSMQKPGFQLLWKIKFENEARQLNGLTPAVLLDRYIGHRGFRSLAFIGGSSDNVFAVDTDLGRIEWQNHYSAAPAVQPGVSQNRSPGCPGGITTGLTRPTGTALPAAMGGRGGGGGRGGPAKSGVGEAGLGAVTLAEVGQGRGGRGGFPDAAPAGRGAPGAPADAGRGAARGGGGGFGRMPAVAYALTSDGMLQSVYVSNGADSEAPMKFLPANANAQGLIVADNVAYVSTSNGCGGAANGVWALDLASKEATTWKSSAGSPAGSAGPAFGPDGTLYVATAGGEASLVALEPKTLKQKDWYSPGADFTSSPVSFEYKGKILIAAATKDGSIHLLDSASLGGTSHRAPLFKTAPDSKAAGYAAGTLASWQDAGGTRWVLAPTASAVVAWKVMDQNGALSMQPGWVSREIVWPLTPMIVNGVIFAASSGEAGADRAQPASHAVLYALDSATGNPLWNSGNTIGSFVHGGGLSGGSGQLYLGTHDGTLYAFGFPIEH
ncbi:MAG TPA: hypothetical protein VNY05_36790 [Candidatus Acidoferrales bacterium]|nr:hypothetical protein [Candidatus Acidoferrales bacterium]